MKRQRLAARNVLQFTVRSVPPGLLLNSLLLLISKSFVWLCLVMRQMNHAHINTITLCPKTVKVQMNNLLRFKKTNHCNSTEQSLTLC